MLGSYRPGSPLVAAMTLCVGVTVTLTAWGHVSQRNVAALRPALDAQQALLDGTISPADIPPLDLGSTRSLEEQLAPYMPLAGLREAGLIHQRVEGTKRLYSVRPEAMRAIADWTMDHKQFWDASLDRLEAHLALSPEGDDT